MNFCWDNYAKLFFLSQSKQCRSHWQPCNHTSSPKFRKASRYLQEAIPQWFQSVRHVANGVWKLQCSVFLSAGLNKRYTRPLSCQTNACLSWESFYPEAFCFFLNPKKYLIMLKRAFTFEVLISFWTLDSFNFCIRLNSYLNKLNLQRFYSNNA